jgi:hypothetical protein
LLTCCNLRNREPSVVEKRIMQLIKRGRGECGADVSFEEPYFKVVLHSHHLFM